MDLRRISVDIFAIRSAMDELIDQNAGSRNPFRLWRMARQLLSLKRQKDRLTESI